MVYKGERKRLTPLEMKQVDEQAIFTLRQYKFQPLNADQFVKEAFA